MSIKDLSIKNTLNGKFKKELFELVKSILIAVIAAILIMTFIFQTVNVDGSSMYPTLRNNDRLIIEKVTYYFQKPQPEDIVVMKNPQNTSERYIKRVIAVEGDKVRIHNNKIYINDTEKDESFIFENEIKDFNEITVPKNTVFVLGDNRNNSKDSRILGPIDLKLISGKAVIRLLPFNKLGRIR
jgi:signal peptidase I